MRPKRDAGRTTRPFAVRLRRDEDGAAALIVAVLIIALLGLAAIVVDAGVLYRERRELQTAADAAALAGVWELPEDPAAAIAEADTYAEVNAPQATDRTFDVLSTNGPDDTLEAFVLYPDRGLFFAQALGIDQAGVSARAVAQVVSPTTYGTGLMPFGLMPVSWEASGTVPSYENYFGYEFGQWIPLEMEIGGQVRGDFHLLDLGEVPQNVLRNDPPGSEEAFSVGDIITTAPGARTVVKSAFEDIVTDAQLACTDGHTWADVADMGTVPLDSDGDVCPQVILLPIIVNIAYEPDDPLYWNWEGMTGNEVVQIVGFARVFVDESSVTEVSKHDSETGEAYDLFRLAGYFLDVLDPTAGEYGGYDPQYGLKYYRLVE